MSAATSDASPSIKKKKNSKKEESFIVVGKAENEKGAADTSTAGASSYKAPLTLPVVQDRILDLIDRVPSQNDTAALTPSNTETLETWCRTVRSLIREFSLVLNFCHPATYQWAPDRSGHNEQNLGALRSEINYSSSAVAVIITDINTFLAPSRDKQLDQCVKTTVENVKTVSYTYIYVVDEEMHQLNIGQLCEEAMDKREYLIFVLQRMHQAISDYIKADDSSTNVDRLTMSY